MAFALPMPGLGKWKAKIYDREEPREEPHVTIVHGTTKWRVSLITLRFMDNRPKPSGVDPRVLAHVLAAANVALLKREWNRIHGHVNPVV